MCKFSSSATGVCALSVFDMPSHLPAFSLDPKKNTPRTEKVLRVCYRQPSTLAAVLQHILRLELCAYVNLLDSAASAYIHALHAPNVGDFGRSLHKK